MTDAQAANLLSARGLAASRVGATRDTVIQLPYPEREKYATILAQIIVQYADRFDAQTVEIAKAELTDNPNPDLEEYGITAMASDFIDEGLAQGERINPFSAQNMPGYAKWLWIALVVLGGIWIVVTFLPKVFMKGRE